MAHRHAQFCENPPRNRHLLRIERAAVVLFVTGWRVVQGKAKAARALYELLQLIDGDEDLVHARRNHLAATFRVIFIEKCPPSLIKSPHAVLLSYLIATMSRQAEKAAATATRGAPRSAAACGAVVAGGRAPPVHLGA